MCNLRWELQLAELDIHAYMRLSMYIAQKTIVLQYAACTRRNHLVCHLRANVEAGRSIGECSSCGCTSNGSLAAACRATCPAACKGHCPAACRATSTGPYTAWSLHIVLSLLNIIAQMSCNIRLAGVGHNVWSGWPRRSTRLGICVYLVMVGMWL